MRRAFLSAAVATGVVAWAAVAGPATADASECQLGRSNTGPRTCVMTDFHLSPVFTLGNGMCAGVLTAGGNGFDGPLYKYSVAPGARHAISLRVTQGFSPIGLWGPRLFACDVTAVLDWHNLDTGRTGSVSRFVPANQGSTPAHLLASTGPGRVRITLRTDRPNIPATLETVVP